MNNAKNKIGHKLKLFGAVCLLYATQVYAASPSGAEIGPDGVVFKPPTTISGFGGQSIFEAGETVMVQGRIIISGITGLCSIALVGFAAYYGFQLAAFEQVKPGERKSYIQRIMWLFVGAAIMGGASLFTGLFYGLF